VGCLGDVLRGLRMEPSRCEGLRGLMIMELSRGDEIGEMDGVEGSEGIDGSVGIKGVEWVVGAVWMED